MVDDSVIPDGHVSSFPPPPGSRIGLLRETVLEESKGSIALSLWDTDKTGDKSGVDKHRLETSNRVDPNHRVNGVNRFTQRNLDSSSTTGRSSVVASVDSRKRLEVDLVRTGQLRIDVIA